MDRILKIPGKAPKDIMLAGFCLNLFAGPPVETRSPFSLTGCNPIRTLPAFPPDFHGLASPPVSRPLTLFFMAKLRKIHGQQSWTFGTAEVEAAVTRTGGHLGPVRFLLGDRWVQPFDLAPWADEKLKIEMPPILRVLRGDFFCMPFGGNEKPYATGQGAEQFPPHGETANSQWKYEASTSQRLALSMETTIRKGRVDKTIELVPGQSALYSQHLISGMKGPMTFGHHAILKLPAPNAGRLSMSKFVFGQVFPGAFEEPAKGGYSILKPGAKFSSLRRVPQVDGKFADLSIYPSREGYEDLVLMGSDAKLPFAWTAMTIPSEGYVWFALKDPRVLRSTVFWMSNGGRHYAPWSGRHRHAIGLEEVTSNFHYGLAESAKLNALNRAGIPTCVRMEPGKPLAVNYIMAVAAIPRGFDIVKTIHPSADGQSVILTSESQMAVTALLNLSFLTKGT